MQDNEELTQRVTENAQRYTELRQAEIKTSSKSPLGDLGAIRQRQSTFAITSAKSYGDQRKLRWTKKVKR